MTILNPHPRVQMRLNNNLQARKRKLAEDHMLCIAKLQNAIETLKESNHLPTCDKARVLVEVFEWSLAELKTLDADSSVDSERIAGVGRLLKRFSNNQSATLV